jgi:hypothetical protein
MKHFLPPKLNHGFACVTSKAHPVVSSLISSYFNRPSEYFMVFTFPEIKAAFNAARVPDDDDSMSQTMGTHAAVRINNVFARLHTRKIFLAGMTEAQKSYIRAYIPDGYLIEIDAVDNVAGIMDELLGVSPDVLTCKSSDVIAGLATAKISNKRLRIDDNSRAISFANGPGQGGLVVIENEQSSDQIVAVNYAASIQAAIAFVKPFTRDELYPVQKLIHEWKKENSTFAYQEVRRLLTDRTDGINFHDYEFATFFTAGFPYGMLLNNIIPFTHVLSHPGADLFVVNNIGTELFASASGSAVISLSLVSKRDNGQRFP